MFQEIWSPTGLVLLFIAINQFLPREPKVLSSRLAMIPHITSANAVIPYQGGGASSSRALQPSLNPAFQPTGQSFLNRSSPQTPEFLLSQPLSILNPTPQIRQSELIQSDQQQLLVQGFTELTEDDKKLFFRQNVVSNNPTSNFKEAEANFLRTLQERHSLPREIVAEQNNYIAAVKKYIIIEETEAILKVLNRFSMNARFESNNFIENFQNNFGPNKAIRVFNDLSSRTNRFLTFPQTFIGDDEINISSDSLLSGLDRQDTVYKIKTNHLDIFRNEFRKLSKEDQAELGGQEQFHNTLTNFDRTIQENVEKLKGLYWRGFSAQLNSQQFLRLVAHQNPTSLPTSEPLAVSLEGTKNAQKLIRSEMDWLIKNISFELPENARVITQFLSGIKNDCYQVSAKIEKNPRNRINQILLDQQINRVKKSCNKAKEGSIEKIVLTNLYECLTSPNAKLGEYIAMDLAYENCAANYHAIQTARNNLSTFSETIKFSQNDTGRIGEILKQTAEELVVYKLNQLCGQKNTLDSIVQSLHLNAQQTGLLLKFIEHAPNPSMRVLLSSSDEFNKVFFVPSDFEAQGEWSTNDLSRFFFEPIVHVSVRDGILETFDLNSHDFIWKQGENEFARHSEKLKQSKEYLANEKTKVKNKLETKLNSLTLFDNISEFVLNTTEGKINSYKNSVNIYETKLANLEVSLQNTRENVNTTQLHTLETEIEVAKQSLATFKNKLTNAETKFTNLRDVKNSLIATKKYTLQLFEKSWKNDFPKETLVSLDTLPLAFLKDLSGREHSVSAYDRILTQTQCAPVDMGKDIRLRIHTPELKKISLNTLKTEVVKFGTKNLNRWFTKLIVSTVLGTVSNQGGFAIHAAVLPLVTDLLSSISMVHITGPVVDKVIPSSMQLDSIQPTRVGAQMKEELINSGLRFLAKKGRHSLTQQLTPVNQSTLSSQSDSSSVQNSKPWWKEFLKNHFTGSKNPVWDFTKNLLDQAKPKTPLKTLTQKEQAVKNVKQLLLFLEKWSGGRAVLAGYNQFQLTRYEKKISTSGLRDLKLIQEQVEMIRQENLTNPLLLLDAQKLTSEDIFAIYNYLQEALSNLSIPLDPSNLEDSYQQLNTVFSDTELEERWKLFQENCKTNTSDQLVVKQLFQPLEEFSEVVQRYTETEYGNTGSTSGESREPIATRVRNFLNLSRGKLRNVVTTAPDFLFKNNLAEQSLSSPKTKKQVNEALRKKIIGEL